MAAMNQGLLFFSTFIGLRHTFAQKRKEKNSLKISMGATMKDQGDDHGGTTRGGTWWAHDNMTSYKHERFANSVMADNLLAEQTKKISSITRAMTCPLLENHEL